MWGWDACSEHSAPIIKLQELSKLKNPQQLASNWSSSPSSIWKIGCIAQEEGELPEQTPSCSSD